MTDVRFHLVSSLSPSALLEVLTDFSPARPEAWPTIDAEHFEVHGLGENWAEVTEGTAAAWERARYDWEPGGDTVTITTLDSKLFGPGGGWVFRMTPQADGTRVDIQLTRTPKTLKGKLLASCSPSRPRRPCASRSPAPSGHGDRHLTEVRTSWADLMGGPRLTGTAILVLRRTRPAVPATARNLNPGSANQSNPSEERTSLWT